MRKVVAKAVGERSEDSGDASGWAVDEAVMRMIYLEVVILS